MDDFGELIFAGLMYSDMSEEAERKSKEAYRKGYSQGESRAIKKTNSKAFMDGYNAACKNFDDQLSSKMLRKISYQEFLDAHKYINDAFSELLYMLDDCECEYEEVSVTAGELMNICMKLCEAVKIMNEEVKKFVADEEAKNK